MVNMLSGLGTTRERHKNLVDKGNGPTGDNFQNALCYRPTLLRSSVKTVKIFSCFCEQSQG